MTDETLVKQALAELGDIVRCHCDEACISRGLHDPSCNCDSSEALATVKKHIRKLTEQLEAARADAKEAEAYAEGLERDLKTCCMAQTVMDNTVAELEKKVESLGREVNVAKYGQPDFAWSIHKAAMADLEDRLAKAVEFIQEVRRNGDTRLASMAIATLAEIESSTSDGGKDE
jgi:chromosome segregation ATPase